MMKITIDLDCRCRRCNARGAVEKTGYCLSCIEVLTELGKYDELIKEKSSEMDFTIADKQG